MKLKVCCRSVDRNESSFSLADGNSGIDLQRQFPILFLIIDFESNGSARKFRLNSKNPCEGIEIRIPQLESHNGLRMSSNIRNKNPRTPHGGWPYCESGSHQQRASCRCSALKILFFPPAAPECSTRMNSSVDSNIETFGMIVKLQQKLRIFDGRLAFELITSAFDLFLTFFQDIVYFLVAVVLVVMKQEQSLHI